MKNLESGLKQKEMLKLELVLLLQEEI